MGFAKVVYYSDGPYFLTVSLDSIVGNLQSGNDKSVIFAIETLNEFCDYIKNFGENNELDIYVDDMQCSVCLSELIQFLSTVKYKNIRSIEFNNFIRKVTTGKGVT